MNLEELREALERAADDLPQAPGDHVNDILRRAAGREKRHRRIAFSLPVLAVGLAVAVVTALFPSGSKSHRIVVGHPSLPPSSVSGASEAAIGPVAAAHLVSATAGWVATPTRLFRTVDGGAHWNQLSLPFPVTTAGTLVVPAAAFLDSDHAWLAGLTDSAHITVARTTDGDRTLAQSTIALPAGTRPATDASFAQGAVAAMSFADAQHGFVGVMTGSGTGLLFATSDGGSSWAAVSRTAPVRALAFSSATEGWASGGGLYRTRDGGRTWTRLHPPGWNEVGSPLDDAPLYRLIQASGRDATVQSYFPTGMMADVAYLNTTDGGQTWGNVSPPDTALVSGTGPQPSFAADGPGRYRVVTGITVQPGKAQTSELLISDDDGRTYRHQATTFAMQNPQAEFSAGTGWVYPMFQDLCPSGDCGRSAIWATSDSGQSWHRLSLPGSSESVTTPTTVAKPPPTGPAVDAGIKVYGDCNTPSFEPTEIVLACADYGSLLEGLSWTSWTSTKATAIGTFVYNDCIPDCARGQHHSIPGTTVTLSVPVHGPSGQLVFSQVQENPQPPGYATGPYHGGPQPLPTQPG